MFTQCFLYTTLMGTLRQDGLIMASCCIKKALCKHSIISRHFFFPGYLFIGVLVKICPVTILKIVLIYGRVRQVKTQFPLWLRFHVTKYMKFLIKVPNAWHSKLTWYQWIVQKDANASNLHVSDKRDNEILQKLHTIYLQF